MKNTPHNIAAERIRGLLFILSPQQCSKNGIGITVSTEKKRYEYFQPIDDPETILLIDSWKDQAAIDVHHASPMMNTIAALREKYGLKMKVERYISDESGFPESDRKFITE